MSPSCSLHLLPNVNLYSDRIDDLFMPTFTKRNPVSYGFNISLRNVHTILSWGDGVLDEPITLVFPGQLEA